MYAGALLAALGLAALSRSETRLALAAVLWWIIEQKVRGVGNSGAQETVANDLPMASHELLVESVALCVVAGTLHALWDVSW